MQRYLISFDEGSMDHIPAEELDAVSAETRAVVAEAKRAGVWIFGGGLMPQQQSIVAVDGSVSDGPQPKTKPVIGGFSVIEVEDRDAALSWASKIAASCRCAQDVREIAYDPGS